MSVEGDGAGAPGAQNLGGGDTHADEGPRPNVIRRVLNALQSFFGGIPFSVVATLFLAKTLVNSVLRIVFPLLVPLSDDWGISTEEITLIISIGEFFGCEFLCVCMDGDRVEGMNGIGPLPRSLLEMRSSLELKNAIHLGDDGNSLCAICCRAHRQTWDTHIRFHILDLGGYSDATAHSAPECLFAGCTSCIVHALQLWFPIHIPGSGCSVLRADDDWPCCAVNRDRVVVQLAGYRPGTLRYPWDIIGLARGVCHRRWCALMRRSHPLLRPPQYTGNR